MGVKTKEADHDWSHISLPYHVIWALKRKEMRPWKELVFWQFIKAVGKKIILNKEVFLILKNYLFLRVSADKFRPPIIWPCIDKNGWCFKFYINSLLFMSLGRAICKELRQRTHSINSSRSQLRRQQFEANIHVRDPMDWGILKLFN